MSEPGDVEMVERNGTAAASHASPEPGPETRLMLPQDGPGGSPETSPVDRLRPGDRTTGRGQRPPGSPASNSSRRGRQEMRMPRRYHKWKSPLLTIAFFILGLGISIGHCVFYSLLNNTIVPSPVQQENNLRQVVSMRYL
jgi:hypothetical protein